MTAKPPSRSATEVLDHLVYATPDLERTIEEFAQRFGVRASTGGQHVGMGTRNALLALGPRSYLEIAGADSSQPTPAAPRWFGIDSLDAPRLVTWAAHGASLETFQASAASDGVAVGELTAGSRERPDGVTLRWTNTSPRAMLADGLAPFFIDWESSPHPAASAASGLTIVELRAEHPDPGYVTRTLVALGIDLRVDHADVPALVAILRGPNGDIELR